MTDNLELRAFYRVWSDDVAFFLRSVEGDKIALGRTITFEETTKSEYHPEPTFSLNLDQAQHLIDELWGAGLRPIQGKQSEGVTAAQARHLEDMRALAFAKLNVERPK